MYRAYSVGTCFGTSHLIIVFAKLRPQQEGGGDWKQSAICAERTHVYSVGGFQALCSICYRRRQQPCSKILALDPASAGPRR